MNNIVIVIISATIGAFLLFPFVAQTSAVPIMVLLIALLLLIAFYFIKAKLSNRKGNSNHNISNNQNTVDKLNFYIDQYNKLKKKKLKLKKKSGSKKKIKIISVDMKSLELRIEYYRRQLYKSTKSTS